ncbi:MAG: hypothetical protein ABI353_11950, partial [Isosphaeraceae bacterium]
HFLWMALIAAFGFFEDRYLLPVIYGCWTKIGVTVSVTWIILLLSGQRRPEPGWIDRRGRILGSCWIAIFLIKLWIGPWFEPPSLSSAPLLTTPAVPAVASPSLPPAPEIPPPPMAGASRPPKLVP